MELARIFSRLHIVFSIIFWGGSLSKECLGYLTLYFVGELLRVCFISKRLYPLSTIVLLFDLF